MLKQLKKNGRKNLKKHYLLFVFVCFVAAFIGSEFVNSATLTRDEKVSSTFITEFYANGINGAERHINETIDFIENFDNNKIFERSKGIFAMAINSFESGNLYLQIANGVISAVHSRQAQIIILIILALTMFFMFYFFVKKVYIVISRRIFLEGRIYSKVASQRFVSIIKVKRWTKVAASMFVLVLFKTLWGFTIIGGIIKKYSYYLVPYIVAENPDIAPLDAIKLSRKMMDGNKWKCFCYELSFIGWDILSSLTAGTTAIFYSNPYKIATFSEFYVSIREKAKKENMELSEKLNDVYLFEKASDEVLSEKYADVIEGLRISHCSELPDKRGIKNFLNRYFGISLYTKEYNAAYERAQIRKMKKEKYKYVLAGETYPDRLFTIERKKKKNRFETLNYLRTYTLSSLLVIFFIICIIGWLYEVSIHLIRDGAFVNRGTMHGPWLPIYGYGGILIITILYNFRHNPKEQFLATIVLCGIIEYLTSFVLEVVYGQRWWDYTGYFININGRICAEGLLVFGIGGLAISYILAPMIDNFLKKINKKILIPVLSILVVVFLIDQIYSMKKPNVGAGVTSYSYIQEENYLKYKID